MSARQFLRDQDRGTLRPGPPLTPGQPRCMLSTVLPVAWLSAFWRQSMAGRRADGSGSVDSRLCPAAPRRGRRWCNHGVIESGFFAASCFNSSSSPSPQFFLFFCSFFIRDPSRPPSPPSRPLKSSASDSFRRFLALYKFVCMYVLGLGSAVSSPSGVWGRAPAEIEFSAF